MGRLLKSIDFYQSVSSDVSQGTIYGATITIVSTLVFLFLAIGAVIQFMTPSYKSDLIIDKKNFEIPLKVNLDIQFPKYPCSILSIDTQNVLKTHIHITSQMQVTYLDGTKYQSIQDRAQLKEKVKQDVISGRGCRMKGSFNIDPVPGNFHFSSHAYKDIFRQLHQEGFLGNNKQLDLSHKVHSLYFGSLSGIFQRFAFNSLKGHESIKHTQRMSYIYFLDIVQRNTITKEEKKSFPLYPYTVRMNQVELNMMPVVLFKFQTSSMSMLNIEQYQEWHILFVKVVGIIGGLYTVALIADQLIHSSMGLLEKQRLGKLR